jgi:hypothetical protein
MYAPPRSRIDDWSAAEPALVLNVLRHVAAVLNLLQCLGVAFMFFVALNHEPGEAPKLLLFAPAPIANVLTMWPCRRLLWANAAGLCINLLWVLGVGGWILTGGLSGWVLAALVVGAQALGLAVQCLALGRHWRRWF